MPSGENNRTVSAEMPLDLLGKLDQRREKSGRSRSKAVIAAVRFWLEYSTDPADLCPVDPPKEKLSGKSSRKT